jgi:hypothetical protein
LPPEIESTCHITVGSDAFWTTTLNCAVPPAATCVAGADTVTVGVGGGVGLVDGGAGPPVVAAHEISASAASNTAGPKIARPERGRPSHRLLLDGARIRFKGA